MLSYTITKAYKRDGEYTAPQVIAELGFLTDAQAVIRNRLEREPARDEYGAVMPLQYQICMNGNPVMHFYHGSE